MTLTGAPVRQGLRSRARPGEQAAKRALILEAKNRPCVMCRAEGMPGNWPPEAMSLDHLDGKPKRMWFSLGSDKTRRARTGGCPPYTEFSLAEVREELKDATAVCLNHQAVISRRQSMSSGYKPRVVDYEYGQESLW